ncbi:MAG: hypothetical protein J5890_03155, partial [Clostridia bacterium]|nr:hypothetical protein [Clostridia bacterium]
LSREKFANTLNSFFVLKYIYIKKCEKNKVILFGKWPENRRPETGRDDIDYMIYKLDIAEHKDLNFN